MSRILVTGGSGFVGAAISKALAMRGEEVWALDIVRSVAVVEAMQSLPLLRFLPGEITEWQHVASAIKEVKPDAVIHCAAIVGVVASADAPFATMRVNVDGAINLMEAMRLFDVRRMINISTEEIYGHFRNDVIAEDHPCFPLMPYGISKFAVEQLARDYARLHDLECIHLRTCWVYGPGLPRARPPKTFVDAAVAGEPLHLETGGDFLVDHVYIDDLVSGVLAALDHETHRYDAYHVASGQASTMRQVVDVIKDLVPGAELSIGPGPMQFGDRIDIVRKGALDVSRARAEFGYEPRYDLRAGLAAYIEATAGAS